MIKKSAYLLSLVFSVLLVFSIIASCFSVMLCFNVNKEKAVKIFDNNLLDEIILKDIASYYDEQYFASGIPSNVYMSAIDCDYINKAGHLCIENAFTALETGIEYDVTLPENIKLNESIESFLSDYAESSNVKKDEAYDNKVISIKNNAYETIHFKSDVFKFRTINSKGILSKLSIFYRNRYIITGIVCVFTLFISLILLIINKNRKILFLYWCGISSLISGIFGVTASFYLIVNKYFDAFSIKQPSVFTAYTETMYKLTQSFLMISSVVAVIGIAFVIVFSLINKNSVND